MRKGGVVVVLLSLVTLASCSSGGGSGSLGGSVSPGHGSPKAAAEQYLVALANGGTGLCDAVTPAQEAGCKTDLALVHISLTGSYSVGNDIVEGNEALVAVTGNVCISISSAATGTTICAHNNDSNSGLPSSSADFANAYETAVDGGSANDATVPCIEVNGSWYANEDFSDGTTPTTETTVPTTVSPETTIPNSTETTVPTTSETTVPTSSETTFASPTTSTTVP